MNSRHLAIATAILSLASCRTSAVVANTIVFGSNNAGLHGLTSATVGVGTFQMEVAAGTELATFHETGVSGLGVNSRPINDATDGEIDKFSIVGGSSPVSGSGESVTFSFDQPGLLTELDFDGVKDEDFEYFLLQTTTSPDLYFFDSFLDSTADPNDITVPGQVIFLQEGSSVIDDRSPALAIPFHPGQTFTLTYGELGSGNGARWQGVTVATIPEPATRLLLLIAIFSSWKFRTFR